jgi:uracil-DNA glycosylase family 4
MRTALNALTDELRRLKTTGIKSVSVSEAGLLALRAVIRGRQSLSLVASNVAVPARPTVVPPMPVAKPKVVEPKLPPPIVTLPAGDKAGRWAALVAAVQADPVALAQVPPGKKIVCGMGNLDARILFIGDAPGLEEETEGEPFVGPAGQLLTKMIGAMGLKRADVYLASLLTWRPDATLPAAAGQIGHRGPTDEEMRYCLPYLRAQIEIVQPTLLVALGSSAAQGLLGSNAFKALGEVRGEWREFAGCPLMVTYHPSYILRNQSNRSKRMIWEDLLKVMERAALPISEKQRAFFL